MGNLMERLMGRRHNAAKSAKDRLKVVLVTDRTQISPEEMRNMQQEILQVIQKYCRIAQSDIDLKYEQRDRENYLVADILLKPRDEGEEASTIHLETSLSALAPHEATDVMEDTGLIRVEFELDEYSTREFDTSALESPTEINEFLRRDDTDTKPSSLPL